jgi:hypothetical protein
MIKSPDTHKDEVQETPRHAGKKVKRATECRDKRRGFGNCGICGSDEIVAEIYVSCSICEKDSFEIKPDKENYFWFADNKKFCDCRESYEYKQKILYYPSKKYRFEVKSCTACGAFKGHLCPNCKKPAWYKLDKWYCNSCGYRTV